VVVPARDGERFLGDALASVLAQREAAVQLIVVDDGSTDSTAAIAERDGALCLRRDHAGPGAARNAGIIAASPELIAFLDQDRIHEQTSSHDRDGFNSDYWLSLKRSLERKGNRVTPSAR
jgi:glycosyltransferase involved in cell wall biosynthesis